MKNGAGVKCEDKNTNEEWIEEALKKRNAHLQKLQLETNIRKISVQAEIDHHEISTPVMKNLMCWNVLRTTNLPLNDFPKPSQLLQMPVKFWKQEIMDSATTIL